MNRDRYELLSLPLLKDMAKKRGLKGLSASRKNEVVDALVASDKEAEAKGCSASAEGSRSPGKGCSASAEGSRSPGKGCSGSTEGRSPGKGCSGSAEDSRGPGTGRSARCGSGSESLS